MKRIKGIVSWLVGGVMLLCMASCSQTQTGGDEQDGFKSSVKWGDVVTKPLDLSGFTKIEVAGNVDVVYTQSQEFETKATGNEKALEQYQFRVENGTLIVGETKDRLGNTPSVRLYVSAPSLEKIEITGPGDVDVVGGLEQDCLEIVIAGSGDYEADHMTCGSLNVSITGSGDMDVDVLKCKDANFTVSGAGDVDIDSMVAEGKTTFKMNGSGDMKTDVKCKDMDAACTGTGDFDVKVACDVLNIDATGSCDVKLKGHVRKLVRSTSGFSKVDTKKLVVDDIEY